jgi:hypothetical protein
MLSVNSPGEALVDINAHEAQFDIDLLLRAYYDRVARIIARVVRDPQTSNPHPLALLHPISLCTMPVARK